MNTIYAQLKVKHNKTVAVEIPTDEEILQIAMNMHKIGKPCLETILGWSVFYKPRQLSAFTKISVDCFTSEKGPESESQEIAIPAEFTFGYNAPWKVVFSWGDGDDKPPSIVTYGEDKIIREPKQETRQLF